MRNTHRFVLPIFRTFQLVFPGLKPGNRGNQLADKCVVYIGQGIVALSQDKPQLFPLIQSAQAGTYRVFALHCRGKRPTKSSQTSCVISRENRVQLFYNCMLPKYGELHCWEIGFNSFSIPWYLFRMAWYQTMEQRFLGKSG